MVRLDRAEQGLGVSCEIGEAFQSRMKYSSECRLLLNCGLPSLNGLVGDTLAASPYRFDRKLVQRRKDLGRDPFRNARQVAQALRGKRGGPPQGQAAQNGGHERLKLLISFPAWQRNLVKTARKLRVTRDRLACVGDAREAP